MPARANGAPARGIAWHVLAMFWIRALAVGLNALTYAAAARALGAAKLGNAVAVVGVVLFVSVIADGGTSGRVSRDAAREAVPRSLSAALRWRAYGFGICFAGASAASLAVLALADAPRWPLLAPLMVAWTWLLTVQSLLGGLLVGLGRTVAGGAIKLVERAVTLGFFGVFILAHDADTLWLWLSILTGVVVSCGLGTLLAWPNVIAAARSPAGAAPVRQAVSLGFFANALGAQLQTLDVALMSWLGGSREAGLLAAPSRVATPLGLLASSAAEIFLVKARHLRGISDGRSARRVAGAVVGLTALAVSPLLFIPDWTIRTLIGNEYEDAAGVFRLIAIGVCISAINQPLAAALLSRYRHRLVGASVITGGMVDLVIVAAAASSWGAIGGGIGVVASQLTILLLLLTGVSDTRRRRREPTALVSPH